MPDLIGHLLPLVEKSPFPFAQSANLKDFTIPCVRFFRILGDSKNASDLGAAKTSCPMTEKPTPKYINPMVDFGFKKIFKESGKKQLIIRPLNAIFELDITDIDIRESELLGLTEQERRATFDMHCDTRDGKNFIIEVQLSEQTYFSERAIFYSARAIAQKAEQGRWDYHFAPVFFLGFLNFDMPHLPGEATDPARFIHKFSLREDETHEQMSRALRFAFLEVARFDKAQEECETFEERFLYLMKNLPTFAEEPELWNDPYFEEFMEEATFASMTFEEQEAYLASMKQKWDLENSIEFREMKTRKEIARLMLADNKPMDEIVKYSGLTEEQVRAL